MSKPRSVKHILVSRCVIVISLLLMLALPVHAKQAGLKKIIISHDPLTIQLHVTGRMPVKVIKVEPKELLVALKGVSLAKGFKIEGRRGGKLQNLGVEKLDNNVLAVVLTSIRPFSHVASGFNSSNSMFTVALEKKSAGPAAPPAPEAAPQPTEKTAAAVPAPVSQPPAPASVKKQTPAAPPAAEKAPPAVKTSPSGLPDPVKLPLVKAAPKAKAALTPKKEAVIPKPVAYIPPKREKSRFKGDLTDLVRIIDQSDCTEPVIEKAAKMVAQKTYGKAVDILERYITQENVACVEEAFFLKAYAYYKGTPKEDYTRLIQAERLFQDALITYPKSEYLPFGYTAIGIIQKQLNNVSAAEGYFNIVKQGYLQYTGLAEVMYHLATIYEIKGHQDRALKYYQQVFEDTEENSYIADAGIGYGRALFKIRRYLDALTVLNYVVSSNPKKVYENHDLLLYIGNANYEVGLSREARESLTRTLNLFPAIPQPDVILSRVGDTYGMENNEEKAIKVYELVRQKFPDSEGFIASSIGIARYMRKDKEKMEIYEMIKNRFPENKYSRIAMMRLAEIYQKNGEYDKCIKEIEDLLSTHPRGLRYEAVKLMQRAYEKLFKKKLKADEYTQVLNRYESEHNRIDRMGSRNLEFSVGMAYLEAGLYEEAFNHLIMAYKQYKRSQRSDELLYGLGVAMDESGRDEDAVKMFASLTRRFKKSPYRVQALLRAGRIYLEKEKYDLASKEYTLAFRSARSPLDKGSVLMDHARVYIARKDGNTAVTLLEKAVKQIALAPGKNYDRFTEAYKELGGVYVSLKKYVKSADAYNKALSFSTDEREKANLGFLMGDAYQKGNILSKAKDAYQKVVASDDSVWARLARQRLSTLELAQTVQNS